jgi:hypothetical protein
VAGRSAHRSSVRKASSEPAVRSASASRTAAAYLAELQRTVGNVAVSALIAREGAVATEKAKPMRAPPAPDKTGIGARHAVSRFVEAAKKVETGWAGFRTATDRAQAVGKAAIAELKRVGVPAPTVRIKKIYGRGEFDIASWTLHVDKAAFEGTANRAEIGDAAITIYHEARHAEQWFRIARLQAGKGWTADRIARDLRGVPLKIAKAAVANPLAPGTDVFASEAEAWFQSVYGSGFKARKQTLEDMPKLEKALHAAKASLDKVQKDPKATAKQKAAAQKQVAEAQKK